MLLFVLACGLSITLGLMNFINLAHGAFAMAGGYCTVILVNRLGVPFFLGLPIAFLVTAAIGGLFERTLYVHVYARSHLDQVLFTIGLVFMSVAAVDYVDGIVAAIRHHSRRAARTVQRVWRRHGQYRVLIIVICGLLTVGAATGAREDTFGSRLRAAVDDSAWRADSASMSTGFSPSPSRSARGSPGSAGRSALKYSGSIRRSRSNIMIYFLIVVTVGGTSSITGPFLASILLGIGDVAGKYYVPKLGAFVIYTIMIVVLIWRPQGLFARAASR